MSLLFAGEALETTERKKGASVLWTVTSMPDGETADFMNALKPNLHAQNIMVTVTFWTLNSHLV